MRKYRLITLPKEKWWAYEVQTKIWWYPFWLRVDRINDKSAFGYYVERDKKKRAWKQEVLKETT